MAPLPPYLPPGLVAVQDALEARVLEAVCGADHPMQAVSACMAVAMRYLEAMKLVGGDVIRQNGGQR